MIWYKEDDIIRQPESFLLQIGLYFCNTVLLSWIQKISFAVENSGLSFIILKMLFQHEAFEVSD